MILICSNYENDNPVGQSQVQVVKINAWSCFSKILFLMMNNTIKQSRKLGTKVQFNLIWISFGPTVQNYIYMYKY